MLRKTSLFGPMEKLPPTEFGRTLNGLIDEEYGTQAAYAERVMLHRSRISQLVRDEQPPANSVLQELIAGFDRPDHQQRLYEAWVASYAPSPLDRSLPEPWDSDELIATFALRMYVEVPAGKRLIVFQTLQRLWSALENNLKRSETALVVGRTLSTISFDIERPFVGLTVSRKMVSIAKATNEPNWLLMALWLQVLAVRLNFPYSLEHADQALQQFSDFLHGYLPRSDAGRTKQQEMYRTLERDALLVAVELAKQKKNESAREILRYRLTKTRDGLVKFEEAGGRGLAYEVISRAEIFLGRFDQAASALAKSQTILAGSSSLADLKLMIGDLRLRAALQETDGLAEGYTAALDLADTYNLLHYRHQLDELRPLIQRLT